MRRWLVKAAALLALCLAIAIVAVYAYLRRSLPDIDGQVSVTGLSSSIDIVRDADAIPHIFAATVPDALFGLGYVHAQDRLWQMEFQRRVGHGRLSEIFGPATVSQDRFLRTVGFGRAAHAAWEQMPAWTKARVNAYVAGVNAFIETHQGSRLPPEFTLLRFTPEPWSGVDVVVWVKMMAWDLSANYSFELLRDDLLRAVGVERMQQLMPPYAADGLSIVPHGVAQDFSPASSGRSKDLRYRVHAPAVPASSGLPARPVSSVVALSLDAVRTALSNGLPAVGNFLLGGALIESLGSNNWVIDGTLSATGKPLLANDPHLGTKLPSTWYLAHLSASDSDGFDVIGATLPGTPAVALGRNRSIAWGATNVAADVEDLYRERLDATGRFATFRGVEEPLTIVRETVIVKGGESVSFDVRITRHGPLVSDAINANNADRAERLGGPKPAPIAPMALRWTALDDDDTTLSAFLKVNEARNWNGFTEALRGFVVPSQNFVYGDVDGHIGYYAPGRIPIRARGDGSLPVDGWSGDAEWQGWISFDALPHLYDPPEHFIVTANNRPAGIGYPHTLGVDWPEPFRAVRITELLRGRTKLTPDDLVRIQSDTISLHARALLPLLLQYARPADTQPIEILRKWDADANAGSSASAIFQAWFLHLPQAIAGDDLGPLAMESYAGRFSYVTRFLVNTLTSNDAKWCDDVRTAQSETCEDVVTAALRDAVEDLRGRLGNDMTRWRWDAVHRAVFPHQGFDGIAPLRPLLSRSVPNGGDWSTVNVGAVSAGQPYDQRSVAGYREIIDLSPANDSRFIIDIGQSGHPLSARYDDFLQDWQRVKHRRMRIERADIENGATGRLRLTPVEVRTAN
jgi:penicillin G amidase